MKDAKDCPTRDRALVGAAGVHTVVTELSLRGLIALPTIRNTAGFDVIVSNITGTWHANLQVKTARNRVTFWPIGTKYSERVSPDNYYVFLRFLPKVGQFEIFLESSQRVAENCAAGIKRAKERGLKNWGGSCFFPDSFDQLKSQWDTFGRNSEK